MKRRPLALRVKRQARSLGPGLAPDDDWTPVAIFTGPGTEAVREFAAAMGLEAPPLDDMPGEVVLPLAEHMHDRERLGLALGAMAAGLAPESVAMVQPMWWLACGFADVPAAVAQELVPSEHPDRREGLLVVAVDREGVDCWIAEVERRPVQPPRLLPFERWPDDGRWAGRMLAPLMEAMGLTPDRPEDWT